MKTRFVSAIQLPLIAGALAMAVAGCSSMERHTERTSQSAGYVGQSGTPGIPPSIDPFSTRYVPFPPSGNESGTMENHSAYCLTHTSQPGCQTPDSIRDPRGLNSVNNRS